MKRFFFIILFLIAVLGGYWGWRYWRDHRFDREILAAARRYQVRPELIKALMWRESNFNPRARGKADDLGLMQVCLSAAWEWAGSEHLTNFQHSDCLNPLTNTLAGTWYLKKAMQRYVQTDNPVPYALAEYNAGHGNLLKWKTGAATTNSAAFINQIGFPKTRQYVETIMARAELYKGSFGK